MQIRKKELEIAVTDLHKLGFGEYQAKVYAGLVALGEAAAPELVDLVEVPKARIYQILDELLEMGVVRKKPGRPIKYVALPPGRGLDNMLEWRKGKSERRLRLLRDAKESLLEGLEYLFRTGAPDDLRKRNFIEIIPAGEISELESRKACRSSKKEIVVLTGVFEYLPRVISEIEKAAERGVKIRVLLLDPSMLRDGSQRVQEEVIRTLKGVRNIELKVAEDMPLRGTIVDSKTAIFSVDEGKYLPLQKEIAVSENENMAKALSLYFRALWNGAKEL